MIATSNARTTSDAAEIADGLGVDFDVDQPFERDRFDAPPIDRSVWVGLAWAITLQIVVGVPVAAAVWWVWGMLA